jgi:preprotein translocase subunit SecE
LRTCSPAKAHRFCGIAQKKLLRKDNYSKREQLVAKKNEVEIQDTQKSGFNPISFFEETKEELAKVVWPSRQQVISESVAVLLMVILSASLVYLVDNFFGWAAKQVF